MTDKKTFTVGFDIADRFTSKFDDILKRINKLTDTVHKIELQLDSGSVSKVEASTARVTRAVQKSTQEFGSQRRALDQASAGFRNLADSMDRASGSQSRLGGLLGQLKGRFGELMNVADDFSDMTRSLAQGDLLGAGRAGKNLASGGGKALAAGLGVSTGALLVGGAVAGAAALSLPAAATWEKQVGRASKTALGEGSSKRDLATDMLLAYQDLRGVTQEGFVESVGMAGSLGYQDEEAVQAAVVGSKAGAAFEISTGEAMKMLGVVNQMWAEQSELVGGNIIMMEKAGSAVNVLGNKYASTEANILTFLSEAGGLAKTWNMDVAETAAIGSVLETVNISASEGANMFKSALNAGIFQKKALSPDAEKALRKVGVRPKGEMGYDIAGALMGVSGGNFQEMLNDNMADTMLGLTDAILEKSGGDSSLAQQMAEMVFGAYGMGFLKLGGQRENLAEMTKEATSGFDAGTSLEEEYKRQTENLIDTFDQTKKIFSSIAKVIGGYLIPPLALLLGVFNSLLGPIVKFGVFMQGLVFKQIDELIGKFKGSKLGEDLGKAMAAITEGSNKVWEVIGPVVVKLLEILIDLLTIQFSIIISAMTALYELIRPYVIKIVDAILAVVDKLKGLWNWLMDSIPGARKEEARLALVKQAEKEKFEVSPSGFLSRMTDASGQYLGASEPSEKLLGLQKKFEDLPGFAEQIADAVKRGLSGFAETIADAIGEKISDVLPDWGVMDTLSSTLTSLKEWFEKFDWPELPSWLGGGGDDGDGGDTGNGGNPPPSGPAYLTSVDELQEGVKYTNGSVTEFKEGVLDRIRLGGDITKWYPVGSHAIGGTFQGTGIYTARFHRNEEVLGVDAVRSGPGIIARAMEALDGSARSANPLSGVNPEIHIHNENRFDFAGAKIDSAFDIAGFMREVDKRIEVGSKKAVERAIGQGRT